MNYAKVTEGSLGLMVFALLIVVPMGPAPVFGEEDIIKIDAPLKIAGEFFGQQVSMDNYHFARVAAMIFKGRWGADIQTPQELEDRVWEDLLLSYEAYRRNITVSSEELEKEVSEILQSEKAAFDWKKDPQSYQDWIKEHVRESSEAFENQLRHLIQIQKLRDQVRESLEPVVEEDEAYQKYLNEYNTLSVEFVQFDDLKSAEAYYQTMKDPAKWAKEAEKNPKFSVKPGFVSLEFLIEVWKFPKEDVYAMLDLPVGSVYRPAPIYKGYAVFHILEKRLAQKDKFSAQRTVYLDKIKAKKQYEGLNAWLKQLKEDAHMKIYVNPTAMAGQIAGNTN